MFMKRYLLLLFFACSLLKVSAQQGNADMTLKFDHRYTTCEKRWVVLGRRNGEKTYTFGYIYIDEQAGFTFDLQGAFTVDDQGRYVRDTAIFKNTGSIKYRIAPNWLPVALLPERHFAELGIATEPEWLKNYYTYTDTAAHNYRWGWIYNDLGESAIALTYLEQSYKINPHARGIEFEMAFAHNVLEQYDAAEKVLEPAIKNDPNNPMFYKELGYAYQKQKKYEEAIRVFKQGLEHYPDKLNEQRGEMAFNMANCYKALGNPDEYKSWMVKAKSYTPQSSQYYKVIVDAGF